MGFAFLVAFCFLIGYLLLYAKTSVTKNFTYDTTVLTIGLGVMLLVFLSIRLLAACFTEGYPTDMNCWAAWGNRLAELGPSSFYSADYFCDYPPGYLYLLGFLSRIASLFHCSDFGYYFLLKLPPVFADIVLAWLLFHYSKKQMSITTAYLLTGLFLFSPLFFYDSAVWGQIESVLLLFLVLAMLQLCKQRYLSATVFYVLAILIKPQGLLLAPIFFLELLHCKNIKTILGSAFLGIAVFLLVTMPFSSAWQEYTGFSMFLHGLNPLWVIEKYLSTLASYPYFTVNAFNFYGLLNLNWVPLTVMGSSWLISLWNGILLTIGVSGGIFLFYRIKDRYTRVWISGYFLLGFLFTFAFKMHERYLILPTLFLLFGAISSQNKRLLHLFTGFSIVGFLNLFYILLLARTTGDAPAYALVFPISLAEVLLFVYSLSIIHRDFLHPIEQKPTFTPHTPLIEQLEQHHQFKFVMRTLRGGNALYNLPGNERHITKRDLRWLTGILLVYTLVAYSNLGNTHAPQTYYQPEAAGEVLTFTFAKTEEIQEIDYYCGVGNVTKQPGLLLEYSANGTDWHLYPAPVCQLKTVFYWESQPLEESITTRHLRLTTDSLDYMLFEVGFRNTDGELAKVVTYSENATFLVDEQPEVTNAPTYENSTYFDEIYHPRTAFEHLHFLPYYETTHPPLGKLIMAIGIAIFGMTPFGWRFMGTLMGILMLPLFYLLLKRMFGRTRYSVLGSLLFAFDFMHFSLTRLATIDSYPVFFILGMYYSMYRFAHEAFQLGKGESASYKKILWYLGCSGLCMGLGCASKWTAVYAAAGLGIEFFVILLLAFHIFRQHETSGFWRFTLKTCLWCLLFFILIPAGIYLLSYLPISMAEGYGNVFTVMWENQTYMFDYHSSLVATHPYSSPWYSWPLVYKPMWAYMAPETSIPSETIGCISIFQNPFLSWVGIAALLYSCMVGIKKKDFRVLFLLIGFLAQYLPWALVSRYALQYHFFAGMVFLILFVIYAIQDLEQRIRRFGYLSVTLVAVCLILFAMFYPVLSGVPISRFWAETILTWFDSWVFCI